VRRAHTHQISPQNLRSPNAQFSQRELTLRAEACLAAHREELIAEAREIVARWQAEGFFGKRARLKTFEQRRKA
jgi:hypothetical protein